MLLVWVEFALGSHGCLVSLKSLNLAYLRSETDVRPPLDLLFLVFLLLLCTVLFLYFFVAYDGIIIALVLLLFAFYGLNRNGTNFVDKNTDPLQYKFLHFRT